MLLWISLRKIAKHVKQKNTILNFSGAPMSTLPRSPAGICTPSLRRWCVDTWPLRQLYVDMILLEAGCIDTAGDHGSTAPGAPGDWYGEYNGFISSSYLDLQIFLWICYVIHSKIRKNRICSQISSSLLKSMGKIWPYAWGHREFVVQTLEHNVCISLMLQTEFTKGNITIQPRRYVKSNIVKTFVGQLIFVPFHPYVGIFWCLWSLGWS